MSRFQKPSHTKWHCQYHIVWTPKYRYRILAGQIGEEVTNCIHTFTEHLKSFPSFSAIREYAPAVRVASALSM